MKHYGAHEYSPRERFLIRLVFCAMYGGGIIMGYGASILATYPPVTVTDGVVQVLGFVAMLGSAVCGIAVARDRWKWEWISLFFLNGVISIYLVVVWGQVGEDLDRLATAGAFTMLNFSLLVRLIDLTLAYMLISRTEALKRKVLQDDAD